MRLRIATRPSSKPAPINQPIHQCGTTTVPTMMTSAAPSFSSAGNRVTGLSKWLW